MTTVLMIKLLSWNRKWNNQRRWKWIKFASNVLGEIKTLISCSLI